MRDVDEAPPGALRDEHQFSVAVGAQVVLERDEVLLGLEQEEGIEDAGHRAAVFPILGAQLAREEDRHDPEVDLGVLRPDQVADALLVGRVRVGVQQDNDEAPDALVDQVLEHVPAPLLVGERQDHLPPAVHALANPPHEVVRISGSGRTARPRSYRPRRPTCRRPVAAPADQQRVLESVRGDQPEDRPLVLHQRIRSDGRRVDDRLRAAEQAGRRHRDALRDHRQGVVDPDPQVVGRRVGLAVGHRPVEGDDDIVKVPPTSMPMRARPVTERPGGSGPRLPRCGCARRRRDRVRCPGLRDGPAGGTRSPPGSAAGAVELDQPRPLRSKEKLNSSSFARTGCTSRRVGDRAPLLVRSLGQPQIVAAAVAHPPAFRDGDVEILVTLTLIGWPLLSAVVPFLRPGPGGPV